jgi:hypothetical protein
MASITAISRMMSNSSVPASNIAQKHPLNREDRAIGQTGPGVGRLRGQGKDARDRDDRDAPPRHHRRQDRGNGGNESQ